MKILFVCTGNTCRSPMAEAIFNHLVKAKIMNNFTSFSRGVSVYNTEPVTPKTIEALRLLGIECKSGTSKQVTAKDIDDATLVFSMTHMQKEMLLSRFKDSKYKITTLLEYACDSRGEVNDPYGKSQVVYNICTKEMYNIIDQLTDRLKEDFDV